MVVAIVLAVLIVNSLKKEGEAFNPTTAQFPCSGREGVGVGVGVGVEVVAGPASLLGVMHTTASAASDLFSFRDRGGHVDNSVA